MEACGIHFEYSCPRGLYKIEDEVVFPDSGSVLLTFLKLEGEDIDADMRSEKTSQGSFRNSSRTLAKNGAAD